MGWARANLLYDCMTQPPKFGSLTEAALLLVYNARVAQGVAATRAVAQASIGGDAAVEAFDEYKNLITQRTAEKTKTELREKLELLKKVQAVKFRPAEGIGISNNKTKLRSVRRRET